MTYEDALKAFGGQIGAFDALSEEGQEHFAAAMAVSQMTYDAIRAANAGGYWKAKKEAEKVAYADKKTAWEACAAMGLRL